MCWVIAPLIYLDKKTYKSEPAYEYYNTQNKDDVLGYENSLPLHRHNNSRHRSC